MEAYRNEEIIEDSKVYDFYKRTRSWVSTFIGVIVTVICVALVFVISSLEGTKEVKAKNSDSVKILQIWRETNENESYPKEKEELIVFNGKEYYFVITKIDEETKEILKWHFAYDGGLEYVFSDYKFYILMGFAVIMSVTVAQFNYRTTARKEMTRKNFTDSLKYYQGQKKDIKDDTQYLSSFCMHKTKQVLEEEKRDIVESAGLDYNVYERDKDSLKLEKWQKKKLKKLKDIKVKSLKTNDLLQEYGNFFTLNKRIKLLPMSLQEHQNRFLVIGFFQKLITSFASGLVVAFGFVLNEWGVGLTYGSMVLFSGISASFVASDFVNSTLKNRFIAKADYLQEFNNTKSKFIEEKVKTDIDIIDIKPEVRGELNEQ